MKGEIMFNWFKKKRDVEETLLEEQSELDSSGFEVETDKSFQETTIAMETEEGTIETSEVTEKIIVEEPVSEKLEEPEEEQALDDDESEVFEETAPKKGFFKSLFSGLDKTRKKIGDQIDNMLNNYSEIDEDLYEELEDILISADVGMDCTMDLIENLREELVRRKVKNPPEVKAVLRDVMAEFLTIDENMDLVTTSPTILLIIGVNGAGKTTSIGKIASTLSKDGKKVIVAAADTFRAAAIDQLKVWADRAGVGVVAHAEGGDPSAVIFDGIKAAQARKADVLICDTAGRLHNKVNLMKELNKMFRVIEREYPEAHREVLLVLDATTGQNALNQAKQFLEVAEITGLILTKLDGTAKGGFVFAIRKELGIPVKLIGVGEGIDDLQRFEAQQFANAVLSIDKEQ